MALEILSDSESDLLANYEGDIGNIGRSDEDYRRNRCLILFMLDAGLRIGEVVRLKKLNVYAWSEISLAIAITPDIAKNKRYRHIPFTPRLKQALLDHLGHQPDLPDLLLDDWIFYSQGRRNHLSTRQARRIITTLSRHAIGREVHPHLLRHTFGTRLMRSASIRIVQELLGHRSIQSTQIYTHPNGDDLRKAIEDMQ